MLNDSVFPILNSVKLNGIIMSSFFFHTVRQLVPYDWYKVNFLVCHYDCMRLRMIMMLELDHRNFESFGSSKSFGNARPCSLPDVNVFRPQDS